MSEILTDLATPNLVRAIQQNLYDMMWDLREYWVQADFEENEKVRRWWSPIPFAFVFNAALSLQPPGVDESELIGETIEFFKTRNQAAFDWWFAPGLETSDWRRQLAARGLSLEQDPPGMAVDLTTLPERVQQPDGLKIEIVNDPGAMPTWTQVFIRGYGLPLEWEPTLHEMLLATLHVPMTNYLASINGQPVATASVYLAAGVAGIYNVATLPAWRGKGIGSVLTLLPLLEARQKGYRAGILQSSESGYRVYQRLGFKQLCTLDHYHWEASSGS